MALLTVEKAGMIFLGRTQAFMQRLKLNVGNNEHLAILYKKR